MAVISALTVESGVQCTGNFRFLGFCFYTDWGSNLQLKLLGIKQNVFPFSPVLYKWGNHYDNHKQQWIIQRVGEVLLTFSSPLLTCIPQWCFWLPISSVIAVRHQEMIRKKSSPRNHYLEKHSEIWRINSEKYLHFCAQSAELPSPWNRIIVLETKEHDFIYFFLFWISAQKSGFKGLKSYHPTAFL